VGFTDTADDLNRGTLSVLAAPRLTRVLQWYAPGQQFLRFGPQDPVLPNQFYRLETGDGVWILFDEGDDRTVLWEQPVIDEPRSVSLPAGFSIRTWTGPTTPVAAAAGELGSAFESLSVWDSDVFLSYTAGLPDFVNKLHELHYGDAFWIRMSEAASWTQPAPN